MSDLPTELKETVLQTARELILEAKSESDLLLGVETGLGYIFDLVIRGRGRIAPEEAMMLTVIRLIIRAHRRAMSESSAPWSAHQAAIIAQVD